MFDPLHVPGYDVLAPLGAGRSWKALAASDRARVVLRPLHGGEETLRRLRREAAVWGSVGGEHVVAVRDVFSLDPYVHVVVTDYAAGGGLDALLVRRGGLDDGEIVTLVVPLAETLASAHLRGLAHGRLSPGNVVFADDGRPMLTDSMLSVSDENGAAHDIAALISVAKVCLGDRRAGPVHEALAATVSSMSELAAAMRAAEPARAIVLHEERPAGGHIEVGSVRPRRHRSVVAAAALIALALVVGVAWGRRDDADATNIPHSMPSPMLISPTPSTTGAAKTSQSWHAVVRQLESKRVRAYRAQLHRDGLRAVGLDIRLDSVRLLTASGGRAVVRVVDGWTSYSLVDDGGDVVGNRPARLHRVTTLVLRRTPAGWRVQRVVR